MSEPARAIKMLEGLITSHFYKKQAGQQNDYYALCQIAEQLDKYSELLNGIRTRKWVMCHTGDNQPPHKPCALVFNPDGSRSQYLGTCDCGVADLECVP